jgi:hypothetical protein
MNTTLEAPETTEAAAPAQITELQLVIADTKEVSVPDTAMLELAGVLRPVADAIPVAQNYAATLKITSQAEADAASTRRDEMLTQHKLAKETIDGFQDGLINKLHKLHRRWTAFRGLFDPLEAAAKQVKNRIIAWQEEERLKAEKEQRRLQAEADERARKERERLEKEAARLKTPEKREERLEAAAAIVAPVVTVAAPVAAVRTQRRWKVKSFDLTEMGIPEAVQGYIEVKTANLERAKAANPMLAIKGITFHQVII